MWGKKKKELEQGVGNKYRDPNESERDSQPQKTIVVRDSDRPNNGP